MSVGDDTYGESHGAQLPIFDAQPVVKDRYGNGYTASFGFSNETDEALEGLRLAAVCFDKAGRIIGGDVAYPDALPGRAIRIDVEHLITVNDQKPDSCKGVRQLPRVRLLGFGRLSCPAAS